MNELYSALCKAQQEMEIAGNNSSNPHYKHKYADLTELVRASRPALTKNGLSVVQRVIYQDSCCFLETILCHSSGQSISSLMPIIPQKNDVQSLGSYLSYLRRYLYAGLVGVVTKDEEDDGEMAVEKEIIKNHNVDKISKDQLEQLEHELQGLPDLAEEIMLKMNIPSLADLPKYTFFKSLERIRAIKSLKTNKASH